MVENKQTQDINTENLKNAIIAMAQALSNEDAKRYKDIADAIYQRYSGYDVDPEAFSCFVTFDIVEKINEQAALRFFPQYASNKGIIFVIKNYSFFDRQLSKIVEEGHGTLACSVDCSRWLIREYIKHLSDKSYFPDMNIDEQCYWKPSFGSAEDWIKTCRAIEFLFWGRVEPFIEIRNKLLGMAKSNKEENI